MTRPRQMLSSATAPILVELPVPLDVSLVDGGVHEPNSAVSSRSLFISNVVATCSPRTHRASNTAPPIPGSHLKGRDVGQRRRAGHQVVRVGRVYQDLLVLVAATPLPRPVHAVTRPPEQVVCHGGLACAVVIVGVRVLGHCPSLSRPPHRRRSCPHRLVLAASSSEPPTSVGLACRLVGAWRRHLVTNTRVAKAA
jgi:hypothetical protein